MLYIKTDLQDSAWLEYILDEFCSINLASFKIKILAFADSSESKNTIYYTKGPTQGICIANKSNVLPSGKIQKVAEDIFILAGTAANEKFTIDYDLFWNAFVLLSRLEEFNAFKKGKPTHSYSSRHPVSDKSFFDYPIVNNLFDRLEKVIKENFFDLPFKAALHPQIEFSHDLDYIEKTNQLKIKQTAFNSFNALKNIFNPPNFFKGVNKTISFFSSNTSYWQFDFWEKIEKEKSVRSVFYVYCKTENKNFKTWLLDPSYDLKNNPRLEDKLKYLLSEDFEIGLHGSFQSAENFELLKSEKEVLENSIDQEVTKTRQHWLRYNENVTPVSHERLFEFDSTLGWNDRIGFRSLCCSRHRPYNHSEKRAFNYQITPQVVMDSNIFDYGSDHSKQLIAQALNMVERLKKYKTAHVSVSWHQRTCSEDYNWQEPYQKILEIA